MNASSQPCILPITPEMAWTVPQLLKRLQLVAPGVRSTTGALRALIAMPQCDAQFEKAFADSGFLSCDEVIGRVRWHYDLDEMSARYRGASAQQVLDHCRSLVARHDAGQPFDWEAVLGGLRALHAAFPELRTIEQLAQLYARLYALELASVHVAQRWLDRSTRVRLVSEGVHHA